MNIMKKKGKKLWIIINDYCHFYFFLLLITGAIFLFQESICIAKHWDNGKLMVSANGHYLQHENGVPFLWVGDTAWALIMRLNESEAETYFSDRKNKGYTVIQTTSFGLGNNILDASWQLGCNQKPFINNNPKTPNEAYWQHVDQIIALAESYNLYIAPTVLWRPTAIDGGREEKIFTTENADDYAVFLANRYKDRPNIIWVNGGDITGNSQSDTYEIMDIIGTTIKSIDNNHLMTYHGADAINGYPSSSYYFHNENWLDFEMTYPRKYMDQFYSAYLHDYNLIPVKPAINGEGHYAGYSESGNGLRRQYYWNILAGSTGYTHGRKSIWNMWVDSEPNHVYMVTEGDNWWTMLDNPEGTMQFMYWKDFFTSIEWWKLIPDNEGIIVSGQGSGEWIKAAARSSDGDLILIYYPEISQAEVNMAKITSGNEISAKWWNPADKSESVIGTFSASGTQSFTPPSGWTDALLVLEGAESTPACINQNHNCCNSCESGIEDYSSLSGTCSSGQICCDICNTSSFDSIIGYWTMDSVDISGTTIFDKSGNNNWGIIHGNPGIVPGKIHEALSFDGVDDYVLVPHSSELNITNKITISAWIKPDALPTSGGTYTIVQKGYVNPPGTEPYVLRLDNDAGIQQVHFGTYDGSTEIQIEWNHDYSTDTWYHVVVRFDGSTYKIFSNGIEKASLSDPTTFSTSTEPLTIGASTFPSIDRLFNGTIDEVRIYNYALSPEEVSELYLSGVDTTLRGDIDGDGLINILDLQACVNHILGTQDWGSAADVNNDTAVNILDIQEIVNIILGV